MISIREKSPRGVKGGKIPWDCEYRNDEVTGKTMISIIDDDDAVRVATSSLVRSFGFDATTFASAEDFLQSQLVTASDCVITDVQMPGMNGVEMQSALRAVGNLTPMIFITAFPEESIRRQALDAGAVAFLSKPFGGNEILACIDSAIGSAGDAWAANQNVDCSRD